MSKCTGSGRVVDTETRYMKGTKPMGRAHCPECGKQMDMVTKHYSMKLLPHNRPGLTDEQREALAFAVMSQVADLAEFWGEKAEAYDLGDIDADAAMEQLVAWMKPISRDGDGIWNTQFPQL